MARCESAQTLTRSGADAALARGRQMPVDAAALISRGIQSTRMRPVRTLGSLRPLQRSPGGVGHGALRAVVRGSVESNRLRQRRAQSTAGDDSLRRSATRW